MTKRDIWTAIWLAEHTTTEKTADFLRSLLSAPAPASSKGLHKVAIIVGHNKKRPGAYAPHPVSASEFVFNSAVAEELVRLANANSSIQIKVFKRKPMSSYALEIDEVYRRVNAWQPDAAMELHFNWLNKAGRIEMIVPPSSNNNENKSEDLAELLLKKFSGVIPNSGTKLIKRSKHERGGRSLWACNCPVVMTEPFDCSNNTHLVKVDHLGAEGVAEIYFKSLLHYF